MQLPANLIKQFHDKMGDNAAYEACYLIRVPFSRGLLMQGYAFCSLFFGILSPYDRCLDELVPSFFYPFLCPILLIGALYWQKKVIDYFRAYKRPGALFELRDKLFIIWDYSYEEHVVHYQYIISVRQMKAWRTTLDNMLGEKQSIGIAIEEKNGNTHKLFYSKMPWLPTSELLYTLYGLSYLNIHQ
ncbi:MAG: hypothetical protein AAF900_02145 [Bacteroidota bacterium]